MSQDHGHRHPVIVGVDGSERSIDALALADLIGNALGCSVVVAFVHPYGQLSSVFSEAEDDTVVRQVAESTFHQVREHLPSVSERRMQLISEKSPAAGLQALAERHEAALVVIGSSHRSAIGRILVGGTGERLLSGAPAPVAIAPAGHAASEKRIDVVGCGFDGSPESHRALGWASDVARTAAFAHCLRAHAARHAGRRGRSDHSTRQRRLACAARAGARASHLRASIEHQRRDQPDRRWRR